MISFTISTINWLFCSARTAYQYAVRTDHPGSNNDDYCLKTMNMVAIPFFCTCHPNKPVFFCEFDGFYWCYDCLHIRACYCERIQDRLHYLGSAKVEEMKDETPFSCSFCCPDLYNHFGDYLWTIYPMPDFFTKIYNFLNIILPTNNQLWAYNPSRMVQKGYLSDVNGLEKREMEELEKQLHRELYGASDLETCSPAPPPAPAPPRTPSPEPTTIDPASLSSQEPPLVPSGRKLQPICPCPIDLSEMPPLIDDSYTCSLCKYVRHCVCDNYPEKPGSTLVCWFCKPEMYGLPENDWSDDDEEDVDHFDDNLSEYSVDILEGYKHVTQPSLGPRTPYNSSASSASMSISSQEEVPDLLPPTPPLSEKSTIPSTTNTSSSPEHSPSSNTTLDSWNDIYEDIIDSNGCKCGKCEDCCMDMVKEKFPNLICNPWILETRRSSFSRGEPTVMNPHDTGSSSSSSQSRRFPLDSVEEEGLGIAAISSSVSFFCQEKDKRYSVAVSLYN